MATPIVTGARVKQAGPNHAVKTYVHDGTAASVDDDEFGPPGPTDGVVVVANNGLAVRVNGVWETLTYDA